MGARGARVSPRATDVQPEPPARSGGAQLLPFVVPTRGAAGTASRSARRPHGHVNLSKFFIDKPIFGVLSRLIFVAGLPRARLVPVLAITRWCRPRSWCRRNIRANPKVIAETVATPIENRSTA